MGAQTKHTASTLLAAMVCFERTSHDEKIANEKATQSQPGSPKRKKMAETHNVTNVHTPSRSVGRSVGRFKTCSRGKPGAFHDGGRNHHCRSRSVARRKPRPERNERRTQSKIGKPGYTLFLYERAKKQPCTGAHRYDTVAETL